MARAVSSLSTRIDGHLSRPSHRGWSRHSPTEEEPSNSWKRPRSHGGHPNIATAFCITSRSIHLKHLARQCFQLSRQGRQQLCRARSRQWPRCATVANEHTPMQRKVGFCICVVPSRTTFFLAASAESEAKRPCQVATSPGDSHHLRCCISITFMPQARIGWARRLQSRCAGLLFIHSFRP